MKRNILVCPKCFSSKFYNTNRCDTEHISFRCKQCLSDYSYGMEAISETKSIEDITNQKNKTCFPVDIIPNQMGINLCSVDSIEEIRLEDGQLTETIIHFIPNLER